MKQDAENWKNSFEKSDKFIQDLVLDFSWIDWGNGSMEISSVPKGWEKIVLNLFESISEYSKFDTFVPKTDWISRLWNMYCNIGRNIFSKIEQFISPYKNNKIIFPAEREKAEKTLRYKIQRVLQNFRWKHFVHRIERKFPPTIKIQQIKQKFAELRIYTSGGDDTMEGMILMAIHLSKKTCEETGKPGRLHIKNGYYRILSKAKAKKLGFTPLKTRIY